MIANNSNYCQLLDDQCNEYRQKNVHVQYLLNCSGVSCAVNYEVKSVFIHVLGHQFQLKFLRVDNIEAQPHTLN